VDKNFEVGLTGPVNHGVLSKVNCFVSNPSAAMRGGFCVEVRAPTGNPFVAFLDGVRGMPGDRSADPLPAQAPMPIAENLTVRALRMKGVPEANITAAAGNPELMQRLIVQNYGSRPARPSRNEELEQSFLIMMGGVIEELLPPDESAKKDECSFCGSPPPDVRLAAGPNVFICDGCVTMLSSEVFATPTDEFRDMRECRIPIWLCSSGLRSRWQ
jgi:hypothetical protein